MRIYLAAKFSRRGELLSYIPQIEALGHIVRARWLTEEHDLPVGAPPEQGVKFATDDVSDCMAADMIVSFTEEPGKQSPGRNRGGRHVEFGMALAAEKLTVIIGPRENVFHYLPCVTQFDSIEAFLAAEQALRLDTKEAPF